MHVTVEMYGSFQQFNKGGQRRVELDLEDELSVRDLLTSLGVDVNEPWNAGLNGRLASPSDRVSDGALLIVFPPIEGG
jgi:molybdopterin converting factor small subunit